MNSFNRRHLMRGGLSLAALSSFPQLARAEGKLVISDPGGSSETAMIKAFYKPFEEATGAAVSYSARPNQAMGQLKAMVMTNNVEWDVTYLSDYLVELAVKDDLLDKIDTSKMDQKLLGEALPGTITPYIAAGSMYGTVMGYSKKLWPDAEKGPQNWADFWDVKRFPGRRAMIGAGYGPIEQALLASGVPRDKIYPFDLDRAYAKLDEIKPHVTVWTTAAAQQHQLLVNGEVDLIHGFANRIVTAMDDGAPFNIQWRDGSVTLEGWVLPKGAKNRDLALKFINMALAAKPQASFAQDTGAAPTNSLATALLPADRAKLQPTNPDNFKVSFKTDPKYLAANMDALQQRWTQWMTKRT